MVYRYEEWLSGEDPRITFRDVIGVCFFRTHFPPFLGSNSQPKGSLFERAFLGIALVFILHSHAGCVEVVSRYLWNPNIVMLHATRIKDNLISNWCPRSSFWTRFMIDLVFARPAQVSRNKFHEITKRIDFQCQDPCVTSFSSQN